MTVLAFDVNGLADDSKWHWHPPCGVEHEYCYDYDDDYCSTPGKLLHHFCILRHRRMMNWLGTLIYLGLDYYSVFDVGGGDAHGWGDDGDDYEDAVDCDQVARIRLRLVLLAFGYAAWIDTCYCWKRPDILVDVIGTLESSNV